MSVLPVGQSLTRFLPDLEDLIHDPRAYLAQEPVTIGPRQMYGLAVLFGLAGAGFLLSCILTGERDGERLALGIGLLCGAGVWLGWSLMMRGHSLVLHPDGVEVKYRDTTVWCPWCVFNVQGHAFVPDADSPRVGLTLPVATESVPFIELRREDTPIAHGAQVKARQWQLIASDTVVLPARYEVMAGELGELILELGRRLGRQTPKGVPPPEAYDTREADSIPAAPDAGGWITAHLTRLVFPPKCCDCGERTSRTMNFPIDSRRDTVTSVLVSASSPLELPIPVCDTCQQRIRDRQHRGGMRGMQVGAVLSCGLAIVLALSQGGNDGSLLFVIGLAALAVGGITGFLLGTMTSKRLPAQLSRYSPGRGTVALRFRHPEYAANVLAAMRARTPRSEPR
ncbi:MAG TPA: hypothetical protein VN688_25620 [Gemmataceae bacterium]|nr:hypothetical protein [Gemmataceae bacterium]